MDRAPEYFVWDNMLRRCYNPSNNHFLWYGAKGVTVTIEWWHFENFVRDMGPRPSYIRGGRDKYKQLDRKDPDGPYCKEKCRWVTDREQRNNRWS